MSTATDDARRKVAAQVPGIVRAVCQRLVDAGHEALTVGGAVRDAILGRPAGDWDVASSATPEQVMAIFRRTIPTGLAHGTVTIIAGPGGVRDHVEVTTFRGEGGYTDGRHPDHIVFGVPLIEDLARRDLVVNAIAYDPIHDRIVDPFDGLGDIAARRLRAVGKAEERFAEDGLRVMRAVRFAAALEFELDAATEAGIAAGLPSLRKVSAERVCVELTKLLAAPRPSLGLRVAARTNILTTIMPELAMHFIDDVDEVCTRVDVAPVPARLAAFLAFIASPDEADAMLRRLKFSNAERELTVGLLRHVDEAERVGDDATLRRVLAAVGRPRASVLGELWRAVATARGRDGLALRDRVEAILERRDPLAVADLAITGGDLVTALGKRPGPWVGEVTRALLAEVLDDPSRNDRAALLARASVLAA